MGRVTLAGRSNPLRRISAGVRTKSATASAATATIAARSPVASANSPHRSAGGGSRGSATAVPIDLARPQCVSSTLPDTIASSAGQLLGDEPPHCQYLGQDGRCGARLHSHCQ